MPDHKPTARCRELSGSFSLVVDGEAPAGLLEEALRHMETCAWCREEFSQFKELVERCRSARDPLPTRECREKLVHMFRRFKFEKGR